MYILHIRGADTLSSILADALFREKSADTGSICGAVIIPDTVSAALLPAVIRLTSWRGGKGNYRDGLFHPC